MKSAVRVWLVLVALLIVHATAVAQTARIAGTVRDSAGRALSGVQIFIPQNNRSARTDSAGQFQIGALPPASYMLRARQLGFAAADTTVQVSEGSTIDVTIVLRAAAVALDTINVVANCEPRRFTGYACRKRSGIGVYLDGDSLTALDTGYPGVGDLFRERPGFRMLVRKDGTRYPMLRGGCIVSVVNGEDPSLTNPMPVYIRELLSVEIYQDWRDVPGQYSRFSWRGKIPCAVIVYWTKSARRF